MAATRTQVYLTQEQRRAIDTLRHEERISLAEVIRRALDEYFRRRTPDAEAALRETYGAVPEASVPSRDEWHRG